MYTKEEKCNHKTQICMVFAQMPSACNYLCEVTQYERSMCYCNTDMNYQVCDSTLKTCKTEIALIITLEEGYDLSLFSVVKIVG